MPDKMPVRIKPTLILVCDDVRIENNGKPFILGIYASDITVGKLSHMPNSLPTMTFALWIAYEATGIGMAEVEFQIVTPNPNKVISIGATVDIEKEIPDFEVAALSFTGLIMPIECPGHLVIRFKHKDEQEWNTLRSIPVNIVEIQTTS